MKKHKKLVLIVILAIIIFILVVPLKLPEKIMKAIYPIKYENFVEVYSKEYNVDKYLIYAVIKAESNFNENATSSKEAKGLMQLMESTAKDILKKIDDGNIITDEELKNKLLEPQFNIKLGTKYISFLLEKYGNTELALVAYNAGSGNVDNWIEQGIIKSDGSDIEKVPYKETNNYVRKILRDYEIYKNLYNT